MQESLVDYFLGTREEKFFFAVKNRMNLSAIATKEKWVHAFSLILFSKSNVTQRLITKALNWLVCQLDFLHRRSLIAQHQAKIEEAVEQAKALRKAMKSGQIASDVSTVHIGLQMCVETIFWQWHELHSSNLDANSYLDKVEDHVSFRNLSFCFHFSK